MNAWYDDPVSHGYITTYQGPNTDTPHFAEDIGTPFHTPLTAPLAGTVKQADYQAWGGEIYIQPDNPAYPEYLFFHPDELEVSVGQHVNAGQQIALSGGENPGYPGAEHPASPSYSTGPHTHVQWVTQLDYYTPDGRDIPYGPDPSNLVAIAKGTTASPAVIGSPLASVSSALGLPAVTEQGVGRLGIGVIGLGTIAVGLYAIVQSYIPVEAVAKIASVL